MKLIRAVLAGLLTAVATSGQASEIALRIEAFVKPAMPPELFVLLTNDGDEGARELAVEAALEGQRVCVSNVPGLAAGETVRLELPLRGVAPYESGVRHAVVKVRYHDANGYPFSSVYVTPFLADGGGLLEEPVAVAAADTTIAATGTWRITALALEEGVSGVQARVVLPDELAAAVPEGELALSTEECTVLPVPIRNLSALAGSRYAVFVVLEGSWQGRPFSTVAQATLTIAQTVAAVPQYRGWMALAAVLGAAFLAAQFRRLPRGCSHGLE